MFHHYLYSISLLATFIALAQAAPAPLPYSIHRRQNDAPFDGPQTITTHNVIPVAGGSVVEDCTITLTPIVVNGQNLVREERRCTDTFIPEGQQLPPPASQPPAQPPAQTDTPAPAPPASTDSTTTTVSESTTTSADPASTAAPPPPVDTTSVSDSASASDGGVSASTGGTGTVPPATTPTDAPATNDPAGNNGQGAGGGNGDVEVIGSTSIPLADAATPSATTPQNQSADPNGTRANDGAPTSSNVAIPGKKLEVLPIGLGVFAGISVIALIVVGLVTYERTKYRKAFRQRRLAQSGADMGYGGMSERR
ncbi:hypothetical protein AURDEDRAFT_111312 [Auricularia subglabra TFB-10046 SS5]|nr:hypothetical protein AURDEDRAFT_111312 [Auricularia subglabra TFB-10046 SS5]